jgi:catechol-2,3-dioxygenase
VKIHIKIKEQLRIKFYRDNLGIRRKVDDPSCIFCSEQEYVEHLFFLCVWFLSKSGSINRTDVN